MESTIQRLARETGMPEDTIRGAIDEAARQFRAGLEDDLPAAGTLISMSEAARRYSIAVGTIWSWVQNGYVRSFGRQAGVRGNPLMVEERTVALLAKLPRRRGPRAKQLETALAGV